MALPTPVPHGLAGRGSADAFSAVGQNWGFPTYNWERMARDGYAGGGARMAKMAEYFDAFRIDHILGFFRIWEIPTHGRTRVAGLFQPRPALFRR